MSACLLGPGLSFSGRLLTLNQHPDYPQLQSCRIALARVDGLCGVRLTRTGSTHEARAADSLGDVGRPMDKLQMQQKARQLKGGSSAVLGRITALLDVSLGLQA